MANRKMNEGLKAILFLSGAGLGLMGLGEATRHIPYESIDIEPLAETTQTCGYFLFGFGVAGLTGGALMIGGKKLYESFGDKK